MIRYLSILILSLHAFAALPASDQPNILWITSEDNGPHLGCYGDAYAVTPNLDALAASGMIYLNASSNAPVCAPARTAIITGVHPTSTGSQHMRSSVPIPETLRCYPELLREAGYYCTNHTKQDYNLKVRDRTLWDDSDKQAHWRNRPAGTPFFAIFNYTSSHESRLRSELKEQERIHDPAKVRVPAYHPDTPETRADWAQYYDIITKMDGEAGKQLRELKEDGLAEDTIIFYYGDHGSGMPRNKRWPYRSGLRVPLIVNFPEKWRHLAPADYAPGGSSDRLVEFVDLAPTLLSTIGKPAPAWMQGRAFAGSHQQPEREFSFGYRGRMDERYDLVRTVMDKRYTYLRHYAPHRIYGQHLAYMWQTETTQVWERMFKAGELTPAQSQFWHEKPSEELYDYNADPDEVVNLVDSPDPHHQAALAALRQAHADWVLETRDLGFLHEAEFNRRSEAANITPYELGRDPKHYDLETIFAAAQLATSQRADDLPAIVELLRSADSGVRYWGATGLLIHGKASYAAGARELEKALSDANPLVAILAAENIARFGPASLRAGAISALLSYADPNVSSNYDAVQALSSLDALGALDASVRDKLQQISKQEKMSKYPKRLLERLLSE